MNSLQAILEIEAIKQLKYRYQRAVDLHDWDALADCFTVEASCAYADGKFTFTGRESIIGFLRSAMGRDGVMSSHQVHHPEITLTGDTTARGVWALHDSVIDLDNDRFLQGAAYYRDEYVKQDGAWRIAHIGYQRLWELHRPYSTSGWQHEMPNRSI